MTTLDSIREARRALRLRETALIILAILFPVSMLLVGMPLTWMLKTPAALWIIAALFVPLMAAVAIWHQRFRCPRCGEPFFGKGGAQKPLAKACLHCGLELVR